MNQIIIDQIIILTIIVAIGYIAARVKVLSENANHSLSDIIFNVTLPFLVFSSVASIKINQELIGNALLVFFFSFVVLFLLYGTSLVAAQWIKLDAEKKVVHSMHTMFGNTIFLGYPLIKSLYGEEGLFYAIIFQLSADIIMWTFGIFLLSGKVEKNLLSHLKTLINPNTVAFAAGLTFMSIGIEIPYVIESSLSALGNTTIPLSMLFIGGMLAVINIKGVFSHRWVFVLSLNKLIISPMLILLLLYYLNKFLQFQMCSLAISVLVMQAATPAMAVKQA